VNKKSPGVHPSRVLPCAEQQKQLRRRRVVVRKEAVKIGISVSWCNNDENKWKYVKKYGGGGGC